MLPIGYGFGWVTTNAVVEEMAARLGYLPAGLDP